jgi:glucans biosynthesis protein
LESIGPWGAGRIELVQLSTPDGTNDNIVAYWVPEKAPFAGESFEFAYTLHWQGQEMQRPPGAWVVQTRVGRGFAELAEDEQQFIVDFAGPALTDLPPDARVEAVVSSPANGQVLESNVYKVEATGSWRMAVRVRQVDPAQATELRGYLGRGDDVLTETWSNILPGRS